MKCLYAAQMRQADQAAIELGIPAICLMENAGRAVYDEIAIRWPIKSIEKIIIIAGKGNNGGDGYVAARHLWNSGYDVGIYLIGRTSEVTEHARVNLDAVIAMGLPINVILDETDLDALRKDLSCSRCNLCVDAIFGTGLAKEVKGIYRRVIECINDSNVPVVSVDIPSGLDSDSGLPFGTAVRASLTVTFAYPKVGLILSTGAAYTGELKVRDISIPKAVEDASWKVRLMMDDVLENIPLRGNEAHKGDFGRVAVFAGSPGFTGAAYLSCEAALRTGAGLVTLGIPSGLNHIMEVKLTEAMTFPMGYSGEMIFSANMANEALRLTGKADCAVIGPGIGLNDETFRFVEELFKRVEIPMVIDADALSMLKGRDMTFEIPAVMTPHPGEMSRLIGWDMEAISRDRIGAARTCASKYHAAVVLKGFRTVIASAEGDIAVNPTGSNSMASGGMGDVLTGIIAAFLAQGMSAFNAACLGVYIHGLASDRVSVKSARGQKATDILLEIPGILKEGINR